jgi:hypothetical protein
MYIFVCRFVLEIYMAWIWMRNFQQGMGILSFKFRSYLFREVCLIVLTTPLNPISSEMKEYMLMKRFVGILTRINKRSTI